MASMIDYDKNHDKKLPVGKLSSLIPRPIQLPPTKNVRLP